MRCLVCAFGGALPCAQRNIAKTFCSELVLEQFAPRRRRRCARPRAARAARSSCPALTSGAPRQVRGVAATTSTLGTRRPCAATRRPARRSGSSPRAAPAASRARPRCWRRQRSSARLRRARVWCAAARALARRHTQLRTCASARLRVRLRTRRACVLLRASGRGGMRGISCCSVLGPVGVVGVCVHARCHAFTLWGWGSAWQVMRR